MIESPIFEQLVADPKFQLSEWLGTEFEPWPDPWMVLPPSPEEAQRVVAERAGWDEGQMEAHAARAAALMAAEQTIQLITIKPEDGEPVVTEETLEPTVAEPEPEEEPEPIEEKDNVDEE